MKSKDLGNYLKTVECQWLVLGVQMQYLIL